MRLSTAIDKFLEHAALRLSPNTIKAYKQDLAYFFSWAMGSVGDSVLVFNAELVEKYLLAISQKGLSLHTLARRRAVLGELGRYGYRLRYWYADPTPNMPKVRRQKTLPRPFSAEERGRLMALSLTGIQHTLRALLYYTGFRVSEIAAIRVEDFASEIRTLRTRGKGFKDRVVPVPKECADAVAHWITTHTDRHPRSYLFPRGLTEHIKIESIEHYVSKWGVRAEVPACSPHRFRHTYATMLLARGADLRVIQKLMGHESIATTAGYLGVVDAQLREAVDRLSEDRQ